MKWEDLDEKHRINMEVLGNFGPTVHAQNKEIKGCMLDSDGDASKTYFDSSDLRLLAESCIAVANWLDLRAEQDEATT